MYSETARYDRTEDIRAITEPSLTGLDLQDFLVEVLQRLRTVLVADTAAVLLVDRRSNELVARAASGLEDEVYRGARVPVGKGFAGRVAQKRTAVFLDEVNMTTVVNPILMEKGVQALLGVPLLGDGDVIGVLHVGRLERASFDAEDAEVLRVAADRVAAAVRVHTLAIEQAAATLLERSLVPGSPPPCPGFEFAARYVPARRAVGGDWYDAFVLPSGELWLIAGDVAGHGLPAAVVMGRVRSIVRSYAFLDWPPDQVLTFADKKLAHFEPGAMVTVVCAVSRPPFEELILSSAGHPPPVLALPGRPTSLVETVADPPLGPDLGLARSSTVVPSPPGAVLVLYTDGLVERRHEPLTGGLDRLVNAVGAEGPEAVCNRVMQQLVGSEVQGDDVTLLVARRTR